MSLDSARWFNMCIGISYMLLFSILMICQEALRRSARYLQARRGEATSPLNEVLPRQAPCEWVQGVKASACLKYFFSFVVGFLFFLFNWFFDLFVYLLFYHKKELRGIFVKKTKIRVKKSLKKSLKWDKTDKDGHLRRETPTTLSFFNIKC